MENKENFIFGIIATLITGLILWGVVICAGTAGRRDGAKQATEAMQQEAVALGVGRYETIDGRVVFQWLTNEADDD